MNNIELIKAQWGNKEKSFLYVDYIINNLEYPDIRPIQYYTVYRESNVELNNYFWDYYVNEHPDLIEEDLETQILTGKIVDDDYIIIDNIIFSKSEIKNKIKNQQQYLFNNQMSLEKQIKAEINENYRNKRKKYFEELLKITEQEDIFNIEWPEEIDEDDEEKHPMILNDEEYIFNQSSIIWEWNSVIDPWPVEGLNSSVKNTIFTTVSHNDIIVRTFGGVTIHRDIHNKGIRLGGMDLTPGRLVIGQLFNVATSETDTVDNYPMGQFDFNKTDKKIKITINYTDVSTFEKRIYFRVLINNNTTSKNRSVLGDESQLCQYSEDVANLIKKSITGSTQHYGSIEIFIDPENFTNRDSLSQAFLCIYAQDSQDLYHDNGITITSIKIEYTNKEIKNMDSEDEKNDND